MTDTGRDWAAPYVVGVSHKMYFSAARSAAWAREVATIAAEHPAIAAGDVVLFAVPGVLDTAATAQILAPRVRVGVQDVSEHPLGAWTGEISADVAVELGCTLAEIGHAERRRHFGETDAVIARKVARALAAGLTPLVCVGEERHLDADDAIAETVRQIDAAVDEARSLGLSGSLLFGYEPVWAIGAPEPASDEHIRAVAGAVRDHVRALDGFPGSRLIYGGAAGPGLLTRVGDRVDGLFLGRFAHDPRALADIIDEAAALSSRDGGRP